MKVRKLVENLDVEGRGNMAGMLHFLFKTEMVNKEYIFEVVRRMRPGQDNTFYLINTVEHICDLSGTK